MTKKLLLSAAVVVCGMAMQAQAFMIDDFSVFPNPQPFQDTTANLTGVKQVILSGSGVVGRKAVEVFKIAGGGTQSDKITAAIGGGNAGYTTGGTTDGRMTMWWDGDLNTTFNTANLLLPDFTAGSANTIHSTLASSSANPAEVEFRAYYGSAGRYGYARRSVAAGSLEFWIPYGEFINNVTGLPMAYSDWTHLNAFAAVINTAPGVQWAYLTGGVLEGTTTVPEPGTFALMGILLSMGGLAFRRMTGNRKTNETVQAV